MDRRLNSTKQYTVNLQFLWRHWPLLKDCDMKIHKCVKSFQCGVFNAQYKLIYLVVGNRKLYIDSWFQCWRVRLTCFCWLVIFRRRFVAKAYPGINPFRSTYSSCYWIYSRRLDQRSCESHAKCVQQRLKWNDDGFSSFQLKTRWCPGGSKTVCSASVGFLVSTFYSFNWQSKV